MTDYPGIDYGLGLSNIDSATDIRYGIISIHSLSEWIWESFEADYGEPTCGECGNAVVEYDAEKHEDYEEGPGCADYTCEHCECVYDSGDCYPEDPLGHTLDNGTYRAFIDDSNDAWLLHSPYYTHAQYCSPCAPGAGHLDNPCPTGPKTYCWGHDWFDSGIAPYPVYSVKTGELVPPPQQEETPL